VHVFVIMGARVDEQGTPSGALRRRLTGALAAASQCPTAVYLATGGSDGRGPTEAEAMRRWLVASGVREAAIWLDPDSTDTLSSIIRCAEIIRSHPNVRSVKVCSDRYHQLRCCWLLRLLGVRADAADMPSGRDANGTLRWALYYVREAAALPYDTLIVVGRRALRRPTT
jgi:vancomycin permeability regulator SanA